MWKETKGCLVSTALLMGLPALGMFIMANITDDNPIAVLIGMVAGLFLAGHLLGGGGGGDMDWLGDDVGGME